MLSSHKKAYLIILDGFGIGNKDKGDAIYHAKTPYLDALFGTHPMTPLKADGLCVGLPDFQTGGSEVGHITIGSGRRVKHLLTKINDEIDSGDFFANSILAELFTKAKKNSRIHFMGLASDGGIHSFLPHMFGLQTMAKRHDIQDVFLHAFLDGRDVGERTAADYLTQMENQKCGKISSIMGRFFAMDRDNNWDRVQKAYDVLCSSRAVVDSSDWKAALKKYYSETKTSDYYFPPTLFDSNSQIKKDDIVICFNYRTDRMRHISSALCDPSFSEFPRENMFSADQYGIFGPYHDAAQKPFCFTTESIPNTLGEVVAQAGKTQLRISETEKFNHITFFFSGERKQEFEGESRILIPSKKCRSYAEKPEMSAVEQTDAALEAIEASSPPDLVVQNFANADLVGHSGDFDATKKAIEILDKCLEKLIPICEERGYDVFVTADHGNSDEMYYPNGDHNASHTKNLVPFCVVSSRNIVLYNTGDLGDIAPTILDFMDIPIPKEMTGKSLVM